MLIAIAVPFAGSFLLKQNDVKATLSDWVKARTGRDLNIDGRLGFEPGLQLRIFAENVRYQNADWASRPSAFEAKRIALDISLLDLLRGRLSIAQVSINNASLWVEQNDALDFNLIRPRGSAGRRRQPIELPEWFKISRANIKNSNIVVIRPRRTWNISLDDSVLLSKGHDAAININAVGGLQDVPLTLEGSLGTMRSLFSRTISPAKITATVAGNTITAAGTVRDVLSWQGLDIELAGNVERLKHLSPLFFKPPLDIRQIAGKTRLVQPETLRTMRLEQINADAVLRGVPIQVEGSVGNLLRLKKIDLQISADGPMDMAAAGIDMSPVFQPDVRIKASLTGTSRSLMANVASAVFTVDGAVLTAAGDIKNLSGDWEAPLPLRLEIVDLNKFGQTMEKQWPVIDVLKGTASLLRKERSFYLEDMLVNSDGPLSRITATGTIDPVGSDLKGALDIEGEVSARFFVVNNYSQAVVPERVSAVAQVELNDRVTNVVISRLEAQLPGAMIHGKGKISDLKNPSELTLSFTGDISDIHALFPEADLAFPEFKNIGVSGVLQGLGDGVWDATDFVAKVEEDYQSIELAGGIKNIGEDMDAQFNLRGTMPAVAAIENLPALQGLLETAGELDGLKFEGLVSKAGKRKWSLSALRINSEWLGTNFVMQGDLNELGPAKGRLSVSVEGAFQAVPKILQKYQLPSIKYADVRFDVAVGGEGVENIVATLKSSNGIMRLSGNVRQLKPLIAEDLGVNIAAEDFISLLPDTFKLQSTKFQSGQAVNADMVLALDANQFTLTGIAEIGESDFNGTVTWISASEQGGRSTLNVATRSNKLDLRSLIVKQKAGPRFFSEEALVAAWMKKLDGEIKIDAEQFFNHTVTLPRLSLKAAFNKSGTQQTIAALSGQGKVSSKISTQASGGISLDLEAEKLPIETINALSSGGLFQGGTLDASVYLSGPGMSLATLMDNGSGSIALEISQSRIQGSLLETVGGDLLSNLVMVINPFRDRDSILEVNCSAIYFDLANGVASTRNGLAMKTDRVTLLGGGEIGFPEESVKIVIAPKARKGLGISPSSIAKMVRIGGTLQKPKVETHATGILKSGAAIGAAIFSGGLTLVAQGLYDRLQAGADACAIARGEQKIRTREVPDESEMRQ